MVNDNTVNNLTSAIAALIEAMGMMAENQFRISNGGSPAYGEESFNILINKHNITGF